MEIPTSVLNFRSFKGKIPSEKPGNRSKSGVKTLYKLICGGQVCVSGHLGNFVSANITTPTATQRLISRLLWCDEDKYIYNENPSEQ